MAILKANGKILKANGKIIKAESIKNELLYLTYFDDFDNDTKIDTPIIGNQTSYNGFRQQYTPSNLELFGSTQSAIKNTSQGWSDQPNEFVTLIDDYSDYDTVSAELFIKSGGDSDTYNSILGLSPSRVMTCDPQYSSTSFAVAGPSVSDLSPSNYDLYNGARVVSLGGHIFLAPGYNIRFKLFHFAIVRNIRTKESYYYFDGDLKYYVKSNNTRNDISLCLNQKSSDQQRSWTCTGIAIWSMDKSTNNKMNYPVPTRRYA